MSNLKQSYVSQMNAINYASILMISFRSLLFGIISHFLIKPLSTKWMLKSLSKALFLFWINLQILKSFKAKLELCFFVLYQPFTPRLWTYIKAMGEGNTFNATTQPPSVLPFNEFHLWLNFLDDFKQYISKDMQVFFHFLHILSHFIFNINRRIIVHYYIAIYNYIVFFRDN